MSILTGTGNPAGGAETTPPAGISAPQPTYEGDFVLDEHLLLDCGRTLANPTLHYAVYGGLNAARDNAVLVCHALSGSAQVGAWWPEIFAADGLLNLDNDCVICVNLLGSCYGSTGPGSVNPESGAVYGADFPLISIRDNVRAQGRLLSDRDPVAVTGVQFVAAAVAVLPIAVATEGAPAAPSGLGSLLAAAGLAFCGTILPFTLFAYAQSRVAADVAGAFLNLEPLVGAVAGAVLFRDPAGLAQAVGGAAILIGIVLSSLQLRRGATARRGRRARPVPIPAR